MLAALGALLLTADAGRRLQRRHRRPRAGRHRAPSDARRRPPPRPCPARPTTARRTARPERPGPRPGAERAGRGLGLPRRRRPERRLPALRPRPGLDAGRPAPSSRRRDHRAPLDRRRRPPPARPRRAARGLGGDPRRRRRCRSSTRARTSSSARRSTEDERYVLEVSYSGTPEPTPAPTSRSDFTTSGWTITPDGETWTMQEPYGAFTWYPVNDQPSDKALYDITVTVPVALGRHRERRADRPDRARRADHDLVAPVVAGVVVPRDGRDRRLHAHHEHLGERPGDLLLGAQRPARAGDRAGVRRPPGWTGWRRCSGPTRSTASASCSSTRAAAWRRRP